MKYNNFKIKGLKCVDNLEQDLIVDEQNLDDQMLSGSAWMTLGSMLSRILGALYIIPWMAMMGNIDVAASANALYQIGYIPYTFFLTFATAGVPSAISKSVSKYNAMGEYETSKVIYKQGLKIMLITGALSAGIMFIFAPLLASTGPSSNIDDAVLVIRSLAPALLIIPVQSITRGLIQGHNRMKEPALSQVVEQVIRIAFILGAVYVIRIVLKADVVYAVAFSTFAAFIGAVASLVYLGVRLKSIPTAFNMAPEQSHQQVNVSANELIIEIIKTSIPFIVVSTGIIIFQLIDQQTYAPLMKYFNDTPAKEIEITYGIVQGNAQKLSTILTSFGAALAITAVPLISNLMIKHDLRQVGRQFGKAIQLLLFIMLPASIGMAILAEPIYVIFFGYSELGVRVTVLYAVVSIFMALYILLGNVLQSANQQRPAIYAVFIGFGFKLVTQPFFILTMGPFGMLASTLVGLTSTCFLMIWIMRLAVHFDVKRLLKRVGLLIGITAIMALVVYLGKLGLDIFLNYESRIQSLAAVLILAVIGGLVYMVLTLKTRIADDLLGSTAVKIRNKLHLKP